jgi:uncharacterized protein YcgI (DUF1989 family)
MTHEFVTVCNGDCYKVLYGEDHVVSHVVRFMDCKTAWCDEIELATLPQEVNNKFEKHLSNESKRLALDE